MAFDSGRSLTTRFIEKALAESETCAVFVRPSGFGPWQDEEMSAAIDLRVRDSGRRYRVIPVLLPGAERAERSSLRTFLAATTWVEFRDSLDDLEAKSNRRHIERLLAEVKKPADQQDADTKQISDA
jgi:hypothetical protein